MNSMTMIEKILQVLICTPTDDGMGAPAMWWGAPGVGKTSILSAFARRHGMPLKMLSPGLHGDGAFGVVPVPEKTKGATRLTYPAPGWSEMFVDDDGAPIPGLVFIDEITTAGPAQQPPLLGLLQQRRVGDHYLGPCVRVFAAGNPPAQAAGGWDLAKPVANRMAHFEWSNPSGEDWSHYMTMKQYGEKKNEELVPLAALEKQVKTGWAGAYATSVGLVTSFIRRRPELLHKEPGDGDPQASRAWPSHRSWDLATSACTTAMLLKQEPLIVDSIIAGFVGHSAAAELAAWRVLADLPDPADLLDGKAQFEFDMRNQDRAMAVLSACAALVTPPDAAKREQRAKVLWKIIGTVVNKTVDIAIPATRALVKGKLALLPEAAPVMIKCLPAMQAAGYKTI